MNERLVHYMLSAWRVALALVIVLSVVLVFRGSALSAKQDTDVHPAAAEPAAGQNTDGESGGAEDSGLDGQQRAQDFSESLAEDEDADGSQSRDSDDQGETVTGAGNEDAAAHAASDQDIAAHADRLGIKIKQGGKEGAVAIRYSGSAYRLEMKLKGSNCYACLKNLERKVNRLWGIENVKVERPGPRYAGPYASPPSSWAEATMEYYPQELSLKKLQDFLQSQGYSSYDLVDKLR